MTRITFRLTILNSNARVSALRSATGPQSNTLALPFAYLISTLVKVVYLLYGINLFEGDRKLTSKFLKAYAVLDGGGAKGAALVGCLKAAEERGVDFLGYGGSSAGSIVALLASIGFTPTELNHLLVDEGDFTKFLDDGGKALERLTALPQSFASKYSILRYAVTRSRLLRRITRDLGLYHPDGLLTFLRDKIKQKLPALKHKKDVDFRDLETHECPPLKVVASDLGSHGQCVFSASSDDFNAPVVDAVRASISYPFVFCPVKFSNRYLVDGGLSSNLPVFLFERERRQKGVPVIAFDLVVQEPDDTSEDNFGTYCGDVFTTALESTDRLLLRVLSGIVHVPIPIPAGIRTFDFRLSKQQRQSLFDAGYVATHSFLATAFAHWERANTTVDRLQALYVPRLLVVAVLRAIAQSFEEVTSARNVRVSVMLPTGYGTKIVVYQYNMDDDADCDLELDLAAGVSGRAWESRDPFIADLGRARVNPEVWRMTPEQQTKVRKDRRALFCVPIFEIGKSLARYRSIEDLDLIGVLSIDTSTPLKDSGWVLTNRKAMNPEVTELGTTWADVLGKMLR